MCRVSPRTPNEFGKPIIIFKLTDNAIQWERTNLEDYSGRPRVTKEEFSFDKVFPPTSQQVFEELYPVVQSAVEEYNVCVCIRPDWLW